MAAGLIERMCEAQRHRGPDSRGMHVDGQTGLGIQRLRIIDLQTGDQPIYNEHRDVVVVLNGEIYNFPELRAELEGRGHRFASRSDTEVIVHLYEELGPACIRRLHGMFGVAIWDMRRRRLVLARDRVGKKPLFYSLRDGALSFASELPALLQDAEIDREPDPRALDAFLALRYVPAPMSAISGVRKLPPATTMVVEDGRATMERYWRLDYGPKRGAGDPREFAEETRERIRRAVRRRLLADVPLGAFLSGGIDSSAVVAAMAETASGPVRTFTIGFEQDAYNELPLARIVAQRFGTEHHEEIVRPDATDLLGRIVRHYGEPFADSSAIPSFCLARMTREHVTVALNGDGGDESFGGYTRYVSNAALARADELPARLRALLARIGDRLPAGPEADHPLSRIRRLSATAAMPGEARYAAYIADLDGLDRAALYTPDFAAHVGQSPVGEVIAEPWRGSTATTIVDRLLDVDVHTYLPGQLLTKMDIASMAYSLEARSPLLDHEFMEWAASLPPSVKVAGRETKVGLRTALRGWVPDEVLDAPKQGFRPPVSDWLRGDLRDWSREVLLDRETLGRGYFREAEVRAVLDRHAERRRDESRGIWSLLMFELWHRDVLHAPAQTDDPRDRATAQPA